MRLRGRLPCGVPRGRGMAVDADFTSDDRRLDVRWLRSSHVPADMACGRRGRAAGSGCPHLRPCRSRVSGLSVAAAAFAAAAGAAPCESCSPDAARATSDDRDSLETLGEVVSATPRALGEKLLEVPGPAVIATFDEIEAGAEKDIDADIGALLGGASGSGDHESAYRGLLTRIETVQQQQRTELGLQELALVGSEEQLREVVEQWPEIMTDEAGQLVAEHLEQASTEDERRFATSMLQTVQLARQGDLAGAWLVRESIIRGYWDETVAPRLRAFEDAKRGAAREALAQAGRDLLAVLPSGAHPELQIEVAADTADALLEDEGADRSPNVESAIALCQHAISILDAHPDRDRPQRRVQLLMNLSAAFGIRPRGDPAWNCDQSIAYLTEALHLLSDGKDRDSWAMAHTNLALLMLDRGDAGDQERAREHLELALTHRSFRRNPRDWAFTQLHLGVAYARADSADHRSNVQEAIRHSIKARYSARSAGDIPLLAQAEHNLATQQLTLSRMPDTTPAAQSGLLKRAEASALESARLSPISESLPRFGRAWLMVGKIRAARADRSGAIEAFKTSLTALSADTGPSEAREASRLLLEVAEAEDDVELAADAAARLVEAAATVISARSRAEDRMSEHRGRKTTDFRFAAHALVRAGRLEDAVTALEMGRNQGNQFAYLGRGHRP